MEKERTSKLKAVGMACANVYLVIFFFIATPYYNWQFAHANGFASWIAFNEVIPTLKAAVWPISICYDRHEAKTEADAKGAFMRYADKLKNAKDVEVKVAAAQLSWPQLSDNLKDPKLGRTQKIAIVNAFYKTMKDSQGAYVAAISEIKPPDELKEFHEAVIAETRGYIEFIGRTQAMILNSDQAGAAKEHTDLLKFRTEARARIAAEADKADIGSWQPLLLYPPPDKQ